METRWREVTNIFYEAGLRIKDKDKRQESFMAKEFSRTVRKEKSGWYNRHWNNWSQTERTKEEWAHLKMTSTLGSGAVKKRAWVWSKKTLAEEELKQCTERYRTSWKSAEKRTAVCRRRGLAVVPEQQHKASELGTGRGRLHAPGQSKRLGHRRGRDDKPLGSR